MAKQRRKKRPELPKRNQVALVRRPESLAARLRQLADQRKTNEAEARDLVEQLRARGTSWDEIARLTDMNSRQAARYRYHRDHPPTADPGKSD
jgi:hypothetical protein